MRINLIVVSENQTLQVSGEAFGVVIEPAYCEHRINVETSAAVGELVTRTLDAALEAALNDENRIPAGYR